MIALIDYGGGNVGSVVKAIEYLGYSARPVADPDVLARTEKIILPGQGHFGSMMQALAARGMVEALRRALVAGTPYFGICLGLQALYSGSDEAPEVPGLGLLPGNVRRFEGVFKVPQVGWNQLEIRGEPKLFRGVKNGSFVYYCHSYYAPVTEKAAAMTCYGEQYAAAVESRNIWGVQFHPEKSGEVGLKVLENFLER